MVHREKIPTAQKKKEECTEMDDGIQGILNLITGGKDAVITLKICMDDCGASTFKSNGYRRANLENQSY